jgi:cytochrome c2
MPQMLSGSQMADATAFLASLKSPLPQPRRPNEVDIGKGSELFGTTGCQACHEQRMQGLGSKYNLASLTAFLQSPAGAMPPMLLDEGDARALAGSLLLSREPAFERPPPNGHPEAGKQVIETSGCLACHALEGAINRLKAKPLAALNSGAGCLANSVGLPNYNLDAAQKQALDAYLVFYRANPAVHPAPIYELRNQIKLLRCNSCHEKEAAPPLNNVGAKFTIRWLDSVLTKGARLRQGHELRMPHYPGLQAAAFAKSEGLAPDDGPASPRHSGAHRETGLGLLGTNAAKQGMGCIGCHDWGQRKSLGEEGPQLINAGQRLRWDWFERWMRDPARILSGTSMPAYFRTMEPGRASDRMLSLWAAMSIGPAAPAPDGFSSESTAEAKPVPGKEAIIIRWDMPEATPAAIAVGLPGGQLSYCFDAGESRLRYIWRGGFLDLSGTLLRKTDKNKLTPTADLVGEIFYREAEFPLRTGSKEHIPQRRFRGYRIVGGVPEFHYEIDGIPVFEKIEPENGVLVRKLRINSPVPVWFQPSGQQVSPGRETAILQVIQP